MLADLGRHRSVRAVADATRPLYRRVNPWTGLAGLDKRVVRYLPEGPGFFIEAGANDGLKQSNTYYLERRRGWRGLLVEPVPRLAQKCRRNRRRSYVANVALVSPEDDGVELEFVDVDLMTFLPSARGSASADEMYLGKAEQVQGITRQSVRTMGQTLSSLIDEAGLPRIDFLSLDVEGYEEAVLSGLDLQRHLPSWILVETEKPQQLKVVLGDRYETVSQLTQMDWLFRAKTPL